MFWSLPWSFWGANCQEIKQYYKIFTWGKKIEKNREIHIVVCFQFDVKQWLEVTKPPLSQRSALIEVIGSALNVCGPDPDSKFRLVFDVSIFVCLLSSFYKCVRYTTFSFKLVCLTWSRLLPHPIYATLMKMH